MRCVRLEEIFIADEDSDHGLLSYGTM